VKHLYYICRYRIRTYIFIINKYLFIMIHLILSFSGVVPFLFIGIVLVVAFVLRNVKVKAFKYLRIRH
jgi:hypothetical protein